MKDSQHVKGGWEEGVPLREGKQHSGSHQYIQNGVNNHYIKSMGQEEEVEHSHKKYSKISLKKRQILIEAVIGRGESLTRTAKKLSIKLSTAKLILRKYRKTGMLFNKNMSAKGKKGERASTQPMQNVQQSIQCKQEDAGVKEEWQGAGEQGEGAELPRGMVIPTVYYPAVQGSWYAYPWYGYPFHL